MAGALQDPGKPTRAPSSVNVRMLPSRAAAPVAWPDHCPLETNRRATQRTHGETHDLICLLR
jgi:hypothetical protein